MRTYCMRSACRVHAVVLVVINVAEGSFTVRNLAEVDGPGRVVRCEKHRDRLSAPIGWSLLDEMLNSYALSSVNTLVIDTPMTCSTGRQSSAMMIV